MELLSDVLQHFCLCSDGCHSFEGVDCEEAWGEHGHVCIISTSASVVCMAGQGIGLAHGVAWAMVEREVKSGKVQRPPSLLPVQFLRHMEVLKILVVCPNLKLAWGTFEVVLPLFQHADDCQHFLVVDFVVPLDGAEAFGEEGDWMPFSAIL